MRLAYFFDMPVDKAEAEKMSGEVSWSIVVWSEDDVVMNLGLHRVPLRIGLDLADWTEMGPWVPSGGVLEITEFDCLVPAVLKRLPPDADADGSFLVVEPAKAVSKEWEGLGLETLFLSLESSWV